jgi:dihydrofolate reductase
MSTLIANLSMSLDGFVAGPDPSMKDPLGIGGEQLHEWAFSAMAWREQHGLEGGEENVDSDVIAEYTTSGIAAGIMGRKMFSGGSGPWETDTNDRGWWGDEPPFGHPVFVLTHHAREPLVLGKTTFHFVTDGPAAALAQAREAADGGTIQVHGGATPVQQYLESGDLDELQVNIAPVLLGDGTPLLRGLTRKLERVRVIESPTGVVHVKYALIK